MFGNRIKLDPALFEKLKACAAAAGYSSVDEFVHHALEKEVARLEAPGPDSPEDEEKLKKRLQGLGYIE